MRGTERLIRQEIREGEGGGREKEGIGSNGGKQEKRASEAEPRENEQRKG